MRRIISGILCVFLMASLVYGQESTQAASPEKNRIIIERLLANNGIHASSDALTKDIQKLFVYEKAKEGVGKEMTDGSYSKVYEFPKSNLRWEFVQSKSGKQENRFTLLEDAPMKEGDQCVSTLECLSIDCIKYDSPVKERYKPLCEENKCKCMCYGCE